MKKTLTTIALIFFVLLTFSQEGKAKYYEKMGETLGQWATCKTVEDFNSLSNKFLVIAQVEKTEWLPLYYAINCKTIMAFTEAENKIKKDAYLDDAEKLFIKIKEIAPEESEIYALEALFFTARLTVDPMTRGQEFSMKSNESAYKSLTINQNNPRAKYIHLANKIGFAQFFGKETLEECNEAKNLLENWDKYNETKNSLAPKWGRNLVKGILSNCK